MKTFHIYTNQLKDKDGSTTDYIRDYLMRRGCVCKESADSSVEEAQMVCLIKPQFEAGKEKVGKKGVVREPAVHKEVIENVMDFAVSIGFEIRNLDFSPIRGPEGNIEYLLHIYKTEHPIQEDMAPHERYAELINTTVENAHKTLDI